MTGTKRPSLVYGLIITGIFFIGFFLMAANSQYGMYVLYVGLGAGLLYWIWSIILIIGTDDLKRYQRSFWLILVIAVPFFGGLLYTIIHQDRNKIAA